MSALTSVGILELCYQALSTEFGIVVKCSDSRKVKQLFVQALKPAEAGDPRLKSIAIHQCPFLPDSQLFLVKRPEEGQVFTSRSSNG